MQGEAIKDAKGLPPNMAEPRNRWEFAHAWGLSPWCVRVHVKRQRYQDVAPHFSGGAFVHGWWSWYLGVRVGSHLFQVWRWRERWAV